MKWQPTPKERKIQITRLDQTTGLWLACELMELRHGDIYRAEFNGVRINPMTTEELDDGEDLVAVVIGLPRKAFAVRTEGYEVMIEIRNFAHAIRARLS